MSFKNVSMFSLDRNKLFFSEKELKTHQGKKRHSQFQQWKKYLATCFLNSKSISPNYKTSLTAPSLKPGHQTYTDIRYLLCASRSTEVTLGNLF